MLRSSVRFGVLIALQLVLMPSGWAGEQNPVLAESDAVAAFERGKKLLEAGKVDKAIEELERGIQSEEKGVVARVNLGRAFLSKEDPKRAGAVVNEALDLGASRIRKAVANQTISAQHYVDRGFAWIVKQEILRKEWAEKVGEGAEDINVDCLEEAVKDLETAIDLDPECFHAHRLLASSQFFLQRYPKSIAECDKALALQPECLELYSYKAHACLECETGRAAGELFAWALFRFAESEVEPMPEGAAKEFKEMWQGLMGSQGWNDAVTACNQALSIKPDSPQFLLLRARAYTSGDMYDKALSDYNSAIALQPNSASGYLGRGMLQLRRNDLCAALEDVERATRLDSDCIAEPGWLARVVLQSDELKSIPEDKVMPIVEQICDAAPEHGECYLLRSIVSQIYGHKEAFDREYKKAFEIGLSPATKEFFVDSGEESVQQ